MLKKTTFTAMLAAMVLATACGGGDGMGDNGGSNPGGGGGGAGPAPASVAGPLDPVQTAVAGDVFTPIVVAADGTPLEGVLRCTNGIVTINTLDIVDAFLVNFTDPAALAANGPAAAQGAVEALVGNLNGLVQSLAGAQTCFGLADAPAGGIPTTNPLVGTPLEDFGATLLAALETAQSQLGSGAGGAPALDASALAGIVGQLSNAYSMAIGMVPPEALAAPVVGGALVTVDAALIDLAALTGDINPSADPTAIATSVQGLVENVLNNLLTKVLPVADLQGLASGGGASGDPVATIQGAVAALTASLGTDPTGALPANPLGDANFGILQQVIDGIVGGLPDGFGSPGGTPLDAATGPLTDLLNTLLGLGGGAGGGAPAECTLGLLGLCVVP